MDKALIYSRARSAIRLALLVLLAAAATQAQILRPIFAPQPSASGPAPTILSANCHTLVTTAATSGTCVFSGPVSAGDLIVAYASSFESGCSGAVAGTVDDTINTGNYTAIAAHSDGTNCQQGQYFYFANSAAGTPTLTFCNGSLSGSTCTGGTAVPWTLNAIACHNCATSSPVDAGPLYGPNIGAGVMNVTSPSITTVHATAVIISSLAETSSSTGVANLGTTTVASPFTLSSSSTSNGFMATQIVTSAGTYTGGAWTMQFGGGPIDSTIAFKGQ